MMNSLTICVPYLLIIVLIFSSSDPKVAAQEGPGIVIAHPGQDVELLCTVTVTSGRQITAWVVNNVGLYTINAIRGGVLTGHTAALDSSNLIVENIMMNDVRNGSEYRCVIVPAQGMITVADIIDESDPTILYVAGVPAMVPSVTVDDNTININGNTVTLTLTWGESFNNLDPIMNYTVSCSGDVTCPPYFTTTDNTTRSYTITNLTPMTDYTFSVVATNSIGSGEAGVVMITTPPGDIIIITATTTTTVGMTTTTISSVGMTTTTSSVGMTTTSTSSVGMTTTTTSTASVDSCNCDSNCSGVIIGALVGAVCVVIIIMVIINIMVWIYWFRKKHHTGTSLELHGPTKDIINPAYYTIADDYSKKSTAEPISYCKEVNKPSEVKMTLDPAYAVH